MLLTSSIKSRINAHTAISPRWRRASGGDILPISLDDVKVFTNRPIEDTFFDDELTRFVKTAQRAIENQCQFALTPSTWTGTLPQFWERIRIMLPPFVDVTAFEYVDPSTGTITTVPATSYLVADEAQSCAMIYQADGVSWPSVATRRDAVRITAKSGYAVTEDDVTAGYFERPDDITHALLMTVASLEKARGDTEASTGNVTVYAMKNSRGGGLVPPEAMALLSPYSLKTITVV